MADMRDGAEEQAGDVGESGGAASGDVAAGKEPKEMGEGMIDALGGGWKSSAFSARRSAKLWVSTDGDSEWRGQNLDCGSWMRQAHWRPVGVWYW